MALVNSENVPQKADESFFLELLYCFTRRNDDRKYEKCGTTITQKAFQVPFVGGNFSSTLKC